MNHTAVTPRRRLVPLFWWWSSALAYANDLARETGRRHRVFHVANGCYAVAEAGL